MSLSLSFHYPGTVAPDEDDVVGVGLICVGDVVAGFCVTGDGNEVAVEAVGKMHDPEPVLTDSN